MCHPRCSLYGSRKGKTYRIIQLYSKMNTSSLRWAHRSVDIRLRRRFDLSTEKSTGVINYASFPTWTRSVSSVTERLQKYPVEIFMWLVSRVGWNIQPRNVHLMNHSERRCSLILVCRRHSTSRVLDFCRFNSASLLWQQHEGKIQNKHFFFPSGKPLQDYMHPLPLVTQKNWFMFFFFPRFFQNLPAAQRLWLSPPLCQKCQI